MWGDIQTQPEKVVAKIDELMVELSAIGKRIKDHEEHVDMALKLGLAKLGDDIAIREWRATHDDLEQTLRDAKSGVQYGKEDFREINTLLPALRASFGNFRRVLDQTEKEAAAGRAAARKLLGR